MLSNDIFIHFEFEKEIGKILILKKHAETLRSVFNVIRILGDYVLITLKKRDINVK